MIPRMDEREATNRELEFAARDGETGKGGCRYCDAIYELSYAGQGIGYLRVAHHRDCPLVIDRLLDAFHSNRDPGDEQA